MTPEPTAERARREGYCPACGYRTLAEGPSGSFVICPVCFWEDGPYPFDAPDTVTGGPNGTLSLREARKNVRRYGDIYEGGKGDTRLPLPDEPRHPDWPFVK